MNEAENAVRTYAPLIGRIMIAIVFLWSAWGKIGAMGPTAQAMTGRGMPMADVLLICAVAIEIVGSVMLVLGWHARIGAAMLAVFLLVATLYFHNYWSFPPADQRNQRNHFTKNIGFIGGLLVIVGLGAGPLSIDNRRRLVPARGS